MALQTIWGDGETLASISLSTDFSSDLLDPAAKFTNKQKVARPAGESSGQESEQGQTSDEDDDEDTRPSLKSPPANDHPNRRQ